jgi:hypothetical protein
MSHKNTAKNECRIHVGRISDLEQRHLQLVRFICRIHDQHCTEFVEQLNGLVMSKKEVLYLTFGIHSRIKTIIVGGMNSIYQCLEWSSSSKQILSNIVNGIDIEWIIRESSLQNSHDMGRRRTVNMILLFDSCNVFWQQSMNSSMPIVIGSIDSIVMTVLFDINEPFFYQLPF